MRTKLDSWSKFSLLYNTHTCTYTLVHVRIQMYTRTPQEWETERERVFQRNKETPKVVKGKDWTTSNKRRLYDSEQTPSFVLILKLDEPTFALSVLLFNLSPLS